ncbi:MAG TPA: dihydrodipicolinate synthase family protein [Thermoanaerobaculia bacterium]|nr:dihydrodipicolinate synthase family protein [Thermoanaerobaculia bacterium]
MEGIIPPLPTPFREDGGLDLGLLSELVAQLAAAPLAGFLALGSNGEAVHLDDDEAERVVAAVRRAAPGRWLLAGTGRLSTRATVDATKRAAGAGADAVLVVTPHFFRGAMSSDALAAHFEAVADASPVPVLLYNVPANTGLDVDAATVARIARHPNVAGVKDSSGDVGKLAELVRLAPAGKPFDVFSGNYGSALPGYAVGTAGSILAAANVAPEGCVAIRQAFLSGRLEEARALHLRLLPMARAVTSRFGVPGLKAALELLGRPAGSTRRPLLPLGPAAREELRSVLAEAGLLTTRAGTSTP